jgi:hypothetical protein
MFDFSKLEYPAFIIVYGASKHYISMYNRNEYDEQFSCGMCKSSDEANRLLEGYPGHLSDVKIYAVPNPKKILQLYLHGEIGIEYEVEEISS